VKSFQFTSKLLEDNESNVTDIGKKRFGQFCRDHQACCCNIASSTWNCDGETLDSSAVEVRWVLIFPFRVPANILSYFTDIKDAHTDIPKRCLRIANLNLLK